MLKIHYEFVADAFEDRRVYQMPCYNIHIELFACVPAQYDYPAVFVL